MWGVECDGETVWIPFSEMEQIEVPTLEGTLPNEVMLTMDEDRFKSGFQQFALWTMGRGEFATLAYCGGLTIWRYETLQAAIQAKRLIDSDACGGTCVNAHVIVQIDPANSRAAKQQANIRKFKAGKS